MAASAALVIKNAAPHAVLPGTEHWAEVISLLEKGILRLDPLLDSVFPRSEVDAAFEGLSTSGRPRSKVLLRMNQREM